MATVEKCENCRFSMAEGRQFICRRMPPTAHAVFVPNENPSEGEWPVKHVGNVAIWPPMQGHGWCGEWQKRMALASTTAKL